MYRRQFLSLAVVAAGLPLPAWALVPPSGPVVLRLTGQVKQTNQEGAAAFDMAMLGRLPQTRLTTRTPWFSAPRSFTGPLLRDVLAAAGAHGSRLRATALNDYSVDIPLDDTRRWDVVLARLLDDKPMPVREKGPLFIIYPFDDHAELRNSVYYSRCPWQLKLIDVQ